MRVDGVEWIAPDVASIHLRGRDLRRLGAAGGQFFIWRFWTGGGPGGTRTRSPSRPMPTDTHARITVRDLGPGRSGSHQRAPAAPGSSFEGPYGLFTDAGRTAPKLADRRGRHRVTPSARCSSGSDAPRARRRCCCEPRPRTRSTCGTRSDQLAAAKGAPCFIMVGPRPAGLAPGCRRPTAQRGVTLRRPSPTSSESDLYICGPQPLARLRRGGCRRGGAQPEHQHPRREVRLVRARAAVGSIFASAAVLDPGRRWAAP